MDCIWLIHLQARNYPKGKPYKFGILPFLFYGATGALCFGLWLTPSTGFKARVDAPLPVLFVSVMDPQRQLWLPRPRPGTNFTPWYVEAAARVTAQCHFWECWQIWTHYLAIQSPTLYRLSYWNTLQMSFLATMDPERTLGRHIFSTKSPQSRVGAPTGFMPLSTTETLDPQLYRLQDN